MGELELAHGYLGNFLLLWKKKRSMPKRSKNSNDEKKRMEAERRRTGNILF